MGCRTRVMSNVYDPSRQQCNSRGNLSFTSINLPRIAIKAKGDLDVFFDELDNKMNLCIQQLKDRLEIQSQKHVYNYPFLMGQGVCWTATSSPGPTRSGRSSSTAPSPWGSSAWLRRWWPSRGSTTARATTASAWDWRSWPGCGPGWTRSAPRPASISPCWPPPPRGSADGSWPSTRSASVRSPASRTGVLHQQLPYPGVLPHLRL